MGDTLGTFETKWTLTSNSRDLARTPDKSLSSLWGFLPDILAAHLPRWALMKMRVFLLHLRDDEKASAATLECILRSTQIFCMARLSNVLSM